MEDLIEDDWQRAIALRNSKIEWTARRIVKHFYIADVKGRSLKIRLNNFPEEPCYTLLEEDVALVHFNDWPDLWKRSDYK